MKKGFTLIELLVVVLIIGILAAVALPQYRVAVERARVGSALPYLKNIIEAKKRYYLANGEHTADLDVLDIGVPYSSREINSSGSWKYKGTPIGWFNVSPESACVFWPSESAKVTVNFCSNSIVCYGESTVGDRVCKSFGGRKKSDDRDKEFPVYYMDF